MDLITRLLRTWGAAGAAENARLSALELRFADERGKAVISQLERWSAPPPGTPRAGGRRRTSVA